MGGLSLVNALANIAVIGPSIKFSDKRECAPRLCHPLQDSPRELDQQFIDRAFTAVPFAGYEAWTRRRAERLAIEANAFLAELGNAR